MSKTQKSWTNKIKTIVRNAWAKPIIRGTALGIAFMTLMWIVFGCTTLTSNRQEIIGNCDTKFYQSIEKDKSIVREDLSLKSWYALMAIEEAINVGADPEKGQWSEITDVWFVDSSPEYAYMTMFIGVYHHNHPQLTDMGMCVANSGYSIETYLMDSTGVLKAGTDENMQIIKDNMEWWIPINLYDSEMTERTLENLAKELAK